VKTLSSVALKEGYSIDKLDYQFVSREIIKEINTNYLKHPYETDIITFDYNRGKRVRGEIYICSDIVYENAVRFGVNSKGEMARVIFHGLLHLVGFNDGSQDERDLMRKKEQECLNELEKYEDGL
jgi:rRNA maturation RNase YbeY